MHFASGTEKRVRRAASMIAIVCFLPLTMPSVVWAQEKQSENTYKRSDSFEAPDASLADVAWIAGTWKGKAMGGEFEETWNAPSADSMMGCFKFVKDGKTSFFELLTIVPSEKSLVYRLKHFDPKLVGWEEKDKSVEFPLVELTENEARFEGVTFRRDSDDGMTIFVVVGKKDGKASEISFQCKRVK